MEENKIKIAQNRGNLQITEDKNGIFQTNYDGEIVIMTLDMKTKIFAKLNKLAKEVQAEKDQNLELKAQIEELKAQNSKLVAEIPNLRKVAENYKAKYEKFAQNQGRGNKTVLTDEYKAMLKKMFESQRKTSLMDKYKVLVLHGYKGTYESVRKYVAESKKANDWL